MLPDRVTAWMPERWRRWRPALARPCTLCRQWDRGGFCSDCRQRFIDTSVARCPRCAMPAPGGQVCGTCLHGPPPFAQAITLADYAFPWDRLITRFKFQQQPELAALLAGALTDTVRRAPAAAAAQLVLPVPLSPARLAERGYNQAWELARRIAAAQGLPARHDALLRLRDTPHQVGLDRRARAANLRALRNAMWVPPEGRTAVTGRQVALVDDVMTTGMTATAATQALLAAGAAGVQVWVLARTPSPQD